MIWKHLIVKSFQLPLASFASFLGSVDDQPPVIGDHGNFDMEVNGDEDLSPLGGQHAVFCLYMLSCMACMFAVARIVYGCISIAIACYIFRLYRPT